MFKKSLDFGQAGDNVGVLLRGTKRDEVFRGQVSYTHISNVLFYTHTYIHIYVVISYI